MSSLKVFPCLSGASFIALLEVYPQCMAESNILRKPLDLNETDRNVSRHEFLNEYVYIFSYYTYKICVIILSLNYRY